MIRAILDTNLLISYLLTQGETMSRLIDHWEQGHFINLISPDILNEIREVVYRPRLHRHMRLDPAVLLDIIKSDALLVPGKLNLTGICRDPKDDPFISCAVEGNASFLVTGDADLLELASYQSVTMIRAYDFVELLDKEIT